MSVSNDRCDSRLLASAMVGVKHIKGCRNVPRGNSSLSSESESAHEDILSSVRCRKWDPTAFSVDASRGKNESIHLLTDVSPEPTCMCSSR